MATEVLEALRSIFQTNSCVVMYPSSGTGAWRRLWSTRFPRATVFGVRDGPLFPALGATSTKDGLSGGIRAWKLASRRGAGELESQLNSDRGHDIKAVLVVHNETSTGVTSRIAELRRVMNRVGHPALLIVDAISSLGSMNYRHDEWEVDVTIAASQKGLMNPPGLSFNAVSRKALLANKTAKMPRSYWDWQGMLKSGETGFFPYTPATNLIYGLQEALQMILEEGMANIFGRHERHAKAVREAAWEWGLEIVCSVPQEYSSTVTAVFIPNGHDADHLRATILDHFDLSLGPAWENLQAKFSASGIWDTSTISC